MATPNVTTQPMPERTWYEAVRNDQLVYVRRGYVLIPCNGGAHEPESQQGNCMLCAVKG